MMTALFILLGLSASVTLFILAAFALNARMSSSNSGAVECTESAVSTSASPSQMVPAFSH